MAKVALGFVLIPAGILVAMAALDGFFEYTLRQKAARRQAPGRIAVIGELNAMCRKYDAAPNDIKRSAIFRRAQKLMRGHRFATQATINKIITDQGGSSADIWIDVETPLGESELLQQARRGSRAYAAAADLVAGQCVIAKGRITGPASILERSKVCDHDFRVKFRSLKPCEQR